MSIDEHAHHAATSNLNLLRTPSQAMLHAGNYRMGHYRIGPLDISIENPAGSRRRPEWDPLQDHYGYIKRSVGADGDHVDCFVRPGTASDWHGNIFVVDQYHQHGSGDEFGAQPGEFDEHKCMVGYPNQASAERAYLSNYQKGWRLGPVTTIPFDQFAAWVKSDAPLAPVAKTSLSALVKGDVDGHVFHGNQWTGGMGVADTTTGADRGASSAAAASSSLSMVKQEDLMRLGMPAATTLLGMYKTAASIKPAFDAKVSEIASKVGGQAKIPALKGSTRAVDKIVADYKGDPSRIKDLVRATIMVDNPAAAQAALAQLRDSMQVQPTGFRDLLDPNKTPIDGYRDIKLNANFGGMTTEVQVNIPAMLAVKKATHGLYEERSNIERSIYSENRQPTAEETAKIDALNKGMRDAYAPVWAGLMSASKSGQSTGAPLLRALIGSKLRGGFVSKAAQYGYSAPAPMATGVPSTSKNSVRGPKVDLGKLIGTIIADPLTKGDAPGHEFHGNQWTGSLGAAGKLHEMFDRISKPDGGFTYSPSLNSEPTVGFALSIHPERSAAFDADKITPKDLIKYVAKNRDLLSQPGNHIGAWNDPASGKVFLDVSMVTGSRQEADRLARAHDQIAYFDLHTFQSVTVNPDATSGGTVGKRDGKTTTSLGRLVGLIRERDQDVREGRGAQSDARGDRGRSDRVGKGDLPGHEFRGNQWTGGAGSGGSDQPRGPAPVSVTGVHYSRAERTELDTSHYGTGARGGERRRLDQTDDPRIKQRAYFYVDTGHGVKPEDAVGSVRHEAQLGNLYDPESDGYKIWNEGEDTNGSESAVLNHGYSGYVFRDNAVAGNPQGAAVLLGPQKIAVKRVAKIGLAMLTKDFTAPTSATSGLTGYDLQGQPSPKKRKARRKPRPRIYGRH